MSKAQLPKLKKNCWQVRLFYACAAGDPVNAKSLIEGKADVNYQDHHGRTALHSVLRMAQEFKQKRLAIDVDEISTKGVSTMYLRNLAHESRCLVLHCSHSEIL